MDRDETQRKKRIYVLQLLTIFAGFIVFGLSENVKGPAIPRIQFEFLLNEKQLGTLLSLNSLGYLIACSFTALLARKIGIKAVTLLAFGSMAASGVLIFFSKSYGMFTSSYFVLYLGNGILEIALALLGARIFVKNTGTMMNLSHFFYGLSSIVAPLMATGLMGVRIGDWLLDWRGMYVVMLALCMIPFVMAWRAHFPNDKVEGAARIPVRNLLRDPVLWIMVVVLTSGVVSELAVGNWLVYYLEKAYAWSTIRASGLLSIFFICFSLARLLMGPLTDRFGFIRSLIIFALSSALCTFGAIAGGEALAWLFAAAGLGIAMIYPTVMAFLAKRYAGNSDAAITFTVTLMGVGSVLGNYVIGAVMEGIKHLYPDQAALGALRGLQFGYGIIGLCALICSVSAFVLYRYLHQRNQVI